MDELSVERAPSFESGDEMPRKSANAAIASRCFDPITATAITRKGSPLGANPRRNFRPVDLSDLHAVAHTDAAGRAVIMPWVEEEL